MPCGVSLFEGDRSVSTPSFISTNKEKAIPTSSENSRKLSGGLNVLPVGLANHDVAQARHSSVNSVSVPSASIMDDTNKDSLVLTELLDSSDDEWANTCVLDNNNNYCGQKVSSTSTSTALDSSGSRINSVASTPCSQKAVTAMSFQHKIATTQSKIYNNFNSSLNNSPQRINTIPNNGNDSKLIIW